jgi:hypothetical protein
LSVPQRSSPGTTTVPPPSLQSEEFKLGVATGDFFTGSGVGVGTGLPPVGVFSSAKIVALVESAANAAHPKQKLATAAAIAKAKAFRRVIATSFLYE